MRKLVLIVLVVAAAGSAAAYFGVFSNPDAATAGSGGAQAGAPGRGGAAGGQRPQGGGGGGFPGMGGPGGGGGGPRVPMTVEMGAVKKGDVAAHLTVVGNLIGLQTVDVAPRTNGRLMSVSVQLGDPSWGNRRFTRHQFLSMWETREDEALKGKVLLLLPDGVDLASINPAFFGPVAANPLLEDVLVLRRY